MEIDSLEIKETLIRRMNESLKEFKPTSPSCSDQDVSTLLSTLLPPLVSAVATSVTVAVGEILDKALIKIDASLRAEKSDPKLLANLRVLSYENDKLQQYSRRENVRIFGLPIDATETPELTEKKAIDLLNKTGVTVTEKDISACHRLGKSSNGTRPVIVRFVSRRKRTEVMRKKKVLRDKTDKVFLNDDLTPLRAKLLKVVKELPNTDKVWTIEGKIMCTKRAAPGTKRAAPGSSQSANPKPVVIESPDDLFQLGVDSIDWAKLGLQHLEGTKNK